MQQVNNVLLSSPDSNSKLADRQSQSTEPKTNSEGDSFSVALEKAASQARDKQTIDRQTADNHSTREPSSAKDELVDAADKAITASVTSSDDKEFEDAGSDDVSQVFAQINLANNFAGDSQLAVNGESLPLSDESVATESLEQELVSDDLIASQLSDEALLALSQQTGLSEQELSQLSSLELKALLQQGQMLDANGALKSEFAQSSSLQATPAEMDADVTKAELASTADKTAMSSAVTDTKSLNGADVKGTNTGRDIFGKEIAGQITASNVSSDQVKSAQNADGANSTAITTNTATSVEQLKGAELSVRTTAMNAGLEANLTGVSEEGTSELKSFAGLQSQALQQQSAANRQELPQFNLSLKQGGEQTPQMQQMIQRFAPVMNQQLITMVSNGIQQAEIRLDPPELGQMMVRIQVQGDTTQVQFQVSQHQTRDLVEQAMPRLREMLAEQGMQLTDGQVSQGDGRNSQGEQGSGAGNGTATAETDEISSEELLTRSNLSTSSASGIDYYA
ncbi:flagellar hook-length control protein FliK [Shewanella pealeana]|uniref:Flagellar hook-length control protein n=1 Tax=Shewanella pealeana (strain ATCC 700345 / ANG-SQ1) TaxID=398579 RepID=A8H2A6_SHEPA|nr:flagellar hook-length control protein FliK [Shewanella pealeana]ABV86693.1 flagellar hook-length control protein [Shewanella pealeana ATCC 700345]